MNTISNRGSISNKGNSTVFSWNSEEFDHRSNAWGLSDEARITLSVLLDKHAKILEAGCGLGVAVKYLSDQGYDNVFGVEINKDVVEYLNVAVPQLNIIQGDLLALSYETDFFDVILSYGVIEHFPAGPQEPLKAMYEVLKPGGLAVITVPSFNGLRKIDFWFQQVTSFINPKKNNFIRQLFGKARFPLNGKRFGYLIHPQIGSFFEYKFTYKQFEKILQSSGFEIVRYEPTGYIDGFYQLFGPHTMWGKFSFIKIEACEFKLSWFGSLLNRFLCWFNPYLHNHMHLCVVRKRYEHL